MFTQRFNRPLAFALAALTAIGCSGVSVVGGDAATPPDTPTLDTPTLDTPTLDTPTLDTPTLDTPTLDTPTLDTPSTDVPFHCTSSSECTRDPALSVCDTSTGQCVACTTTEDRCPTGNYCVDATHTCTSGCRDDNACTTSTSDGGATSRHCDPTTHTCLDCLQDQHCPSGTLCVGNTCVTGCSSTHPCPGTQSCCSGACVDTQANTAHCGMCDNRCQVANAAASCMNGTCAVASCTAPFADCDSSPANGCETDTSRDVTHCGACNTACVSRPNTVTNCTAGACNYTCSAGFADCDGDSSNGCEVDTRASASHCGGCGVVCNPPNAMGACTNGMCTITTCSTGFGDCDSNVTNGCETDTRANTTHCGACNNACPAVANALPGCVGSRCVMACLAGFADCNSSPSDGCEVDTRADVNHCGRCGARCTPSNATGTCTAGACTIAACSTGYGDCDGDPSNGCETNNQNTPTHCGTCGHNCPVPANTSATCTTGTCGFTCLAGFGDCDGDPANGCEVNLTNTPGHCGTCATTCSSGVCAGGACQAPRCDDHVRNGNESDVDCGGSCNRCDLCRQCSGPSDCTTSACGTTGRCTFATDVTINWLSNCFGGGGGNTAVNIPGMPAGTYTVTALPSGATVWSSSYCPGSGWFWYITCDNFSVPALTAPSACYISPEAAFAALPTTTSTATFAGGTLSCRFNDSPCSDNRGSIRFRVERTCP